MAQQPPFAFPPKQFPQRPQPPQPQPRTNVDPKNFVTCECGCKIFNKEGCFLSIVPGQVIGTVDVTFVTAPYCVNCLMPFNLEKAMKKREAKEPEQQEVKEGA